MGPNHRLGSMLEQHEDALVVRVFSRMIAIHGYDRALALSAQAFVGLVPVLVVFAALTPDGLRRQGGTALTALGLPAGDAASSIAVMFRAPPGAGTVTILGAVLLVLAVLGFTRALQRTYVAAWGLPSTGLRGLSRGVLAAAALIAGFGALILLAPLLALIDTFRLAELIIHAGGATLLWWPVQRVLLDGRVGWRALFPGAALAGCGQSLVLAVSVRYLPEAVSREAARYGLIGVAVALVSWLVVLGLLLVLSAVLSAELAGVTRPGAPEAS